MFFLKPFLEDAVFGERSVFLLLYAGFWRSRRCIVAISDVQLVRSIVYMIMMTLSYLSRELVIFGRAIQA